MAGLYDPNSISVIGRLLDRGFDMRQITRTMIQLVGSDWREVNVSTWTKRLRSDGLIKHGDEDSLVDDLGALISGKIKLDEIARDHKVRNEDY